MCSIRLTSGSHALPTPAAADGVSLADEEAEGLFRVGQYGAVYQLEARLNEMMLRIKV